MYDSDISVEEVAKKFPRVHVSTLYRWKKHYEDWGEAPSQTRAYAKKHLRTWKKCSKVTKPVLERLKEVVDDAPELYLDEIQSRLAVDGYKLAVSTISTALRSRLQYTLRMITDMAAQRDAVLRLEFQQQLASFELPYLFTFIDETHKGRNASRRRRAWARRGTDNSISAFFAPGRDALYSLLAAVDINGFIEAACEIIERASGDDDTNEAHGTVDADRFVDWVEHFLCPVLGNYSKLEPRSVVVLDNASLHCDPRVRTLIEGVGAILIYTSPYSPDLNPIERCFHQYKAFLKRWTHVFGVHRTHQLALSSVTHDNMCSYYSSVTAIQNVPVRASRANMRRAAIAAALAASTSTTNKRVCQ